MGIHDRAYYQEDRRDGVNFADWPWSYRLIVLNVAVFLLDNLLRGPQDLYGPLTKWGAHNSALAINGLQVWRFFAYQFLHFDVPHLFWNMLCLWIFGPILENAIGRRSFLALYLLSGLGGGIIHTLLGYAGVIDVSSSILVGASGSIFGVLAACAVVAPTMQVLVMFILPMTMRQMAILMLGISSLTILMRGPNAGGEACHLGGALIGFVLIKRRDWLDQVAELGGLLGNRRFKKKLPSIGSIFTKPGVSEVELDRLLDKVHAEGLESLSNSEKATLKRASRERRNRSNQR